MNKRYEVIVIGGGHAGCEAAHASAKMGCRTLLITSDVTKIAQMSCNPSIGGIGKGQIVREIDALGGKTGKVTDETSIQSRMLNLSKGPAMHSPRAQCDRDLFSLAWRKELDSTDNLYIIQDTITSLLISKDNRCLGVSSKQWGEIQAQKVIITAGTFLNGLIHIGLYHTPGGRIDEAAVPQLSNQLAKAGVETLRFKTGTSPRVDLRTINTSEMQIQKGGEKQIFFSYDSYEWNGLLQRPCYLVYTNAYTHEIIRENLDQSPLYQKVIHGRGPRYCPSIEDKIHMFESKDRHQLFLEPEGVTSNTIYINGFSSSLPLEVQEKALRSVKGLEEVHIIRPGYAIEYDFFNPQQLDHTLESQVVSNLYIAGQLNGTTGYEEAAAQGLIAGINAALSIHERPSYIASRESSYIGVMIDDLISYGVDEPYRMFTSRAEHRLLLRQDNADIRLVDIGCRLGLQEEDVLRRTQKKLADIDQIKELLQVQKIVPNTSNCFLDEQSSSQIKEPVKAQQLALRPEISLSALLDHIYRQEGKRVPYPDETILSAEIEIKYASYIEKERIAIGNQGKVGKIRIPSDILLDPPESLSHETREKIMRRRPETLEELRRIPGVRLSDIQTIVAYLNRKEK